MAKPLKEIPTFRSDDEAREFWATHDSTEYVDWDKAEDACSSDFALTLPDSWPQLPWG
jgi:hypothetical protein